VSEAGERGNQTPDHALRRAEEERGDMLSSRSEDEVGALQRRDPRGARTSERSNQTPDHASRRAEEEGGDMLFVPERRRSRRAAKA
jgi:hypothetical protein